MSRSNSILLSILLTVALTLMSCNRKTVYDHYNHTPLTGWEKNDTLTFDVGPFPYDATLHEEVGLRINDTYPFRGLCLIVEQTRWPSGAHRSDTLNCSFMDSDGTVMGPGVSYYQYNFHLTDQPFQAGDSLHICIRHNMKREILPGIADVGILLVRK